MTKRQGQLFEAIHQVSRRNRANGFFTASLCATTSSANSFHALLKRYAKSAFPHHPNFKVVFTSRRTAAAPGVLMRSYHKYNPTISLLFFDSDLEILIPDDFDHPPNFLILHDSTQYQFIDLNTFERTPYSKKMKRYASTLDKWFGSTLPDHPPHLR